MISDFFQTWAMCFFPLVLLSLSLAAVVEFIEDVVKPNIPDTLILFLAVGFLSLVLSFVIGLH